MADGFQTMHRVLPGTPGAFQDNEGEWYANDADPLIGGVQYRSVAAGDVARLRSQGLNVQQHPEYGWIAPDDAKYAAAFPAREESGFDKALGVIMPGLIKAGMVAGGLAGFGGMAAGIPPASVDTYGIQQMGEAAGLRGEALQSFVDSGGTMGSTAAGGGGVGTGAAAPFGVDARFQSGMQYYDSPTAVSASSSGGMSSADQAGLERMAKDIGLTGEAAQAFVDNGGMASTSSLADLPGYAAPGTVPIGNFGLSPGGVPYGINTPSGNIGTAAKAAAGTAAAKTALGKLLAGETLSSDDLSKLLGTAGSTALGVAGGMNQSNAIREANDKNAAAFAAAQERAMATLTEGQRQALKSSGAGKEEAIKAYKASLAEAVRYNEQALKSGVSGFESGRDASIKASTDALASGLGYNEQALGKSLSGLQTTRDQSLAMSNAARDEGMGILQDAQAGALGANSATEERYFGIGAPSRARLEESYKPGFSINNEPGYKDAIDQVMNSYLRKASVGGNPFENPGVSMEANKYVTAGTALPQLNTYRSQNAASGNVGLNTAGSAGLQRPGIYSSLGQLQSNLSSDFGKFDANLNTTAGTNMANLTSRAGEFGTNLISDTGRSVAGAAERAGTNIGGANLAAGQYNTGLIDRSGANVAGANMTAGQNDANLIGNLAKAGAQVQGGTYNTVPTSNSGVYNALGSGLASLTNPQQDYSDIINQILKQYQLSAGRSL